MEQFSERLKKALEIKGLLPIDLARKSNIDKGSISKYLKGNIIPKQTKLFAISNALHVDPTWLLGYDVPMEKATDTIDSFMSDYNALNDINKAMARAYVKALLDGQVTKTPAQADAQ